MLDQNTAILLSALLGGLLSILGGLIANYYIQSSSDKVQKKKEIRNILEHIYKCTQTISLSYLQLQKGVPDKEVDKKLLEIRESLENIESMVNLYLPPLKQDFAEYEEEINSRISAVSSGRRYTANHISSAISEYRAYNLPPLEDINHKFRSLLADMLKKKGYNYF